MRDKKQQQGREDTRGGELAPRPGSLSVPAEGGATAPSRHPAPASLEWRASSATQKRGEIAVKNVRSLDSSAPERGPRAPRAGLPIAGQHRRPVAERPHCTQRPGLGRVREGPRPRLRLPQCWAPPRPTPGDTPGLRGLFFT